MDCIVALDFVVLHGFFWVCMLGCMFLPCDHLYSSMLIHMVLPV
jgi:hypothetical protein